MADASQLAVDNAGLRWRDIDGLLCGYATTLPHLMPATLLGERLGLRPACAHGMQAGGATGAAMVMLARDLVRGGRCRHVLAVAGENRLSGQERDSAIQTLAQVGHPVFEVPNGASVPACYGLLASEYMAATASREEDLAELAVLMRRHAASHPQAHLRAPMRCEDVLASRPVATPLKLLDCCPISDGAVALVISAEPHAQTGVRIAGAGQAHLHQHLTAMRDVLDCGAAQAARRALDEAGLEPQAIDYLGIYDSFTITLAMLLEETGFAPRGRAGALAREGFFNASGTLPLNTHGGLLSFGHCGVAGGMAHVAEAWLQMSGHAGDRQIKPPRNAFIHADGGVMSSHVSLLLRREG
jgi:acetyl-CoA acetyltransferase